MNYADLVERYERERYKYIQPHSPSDAAERGEERHGDADVHMGEGDPIGVEPVGQGNSEIQRLLSRRYQRRPSTRAFRLAIGR